MGLDAGSSQPAVSFSVGALRLVRRLVRLRVLQRPARPWAAMVQRRLVDSPTDERVAFRGVDLAARRRIGVRGERRDGKTPALGNQVA